MNNPDDVKLFPGEKVVKHCSNKNCKNYADPFWERTYKFCGLCGSNLEEDWVAHMDT